MVSKMTRKEIAAVARISEAFYDEAWKNVAKKQKTLIAQPHRAEAILQTARAELAKLGEAWRVGEGAEIMDAYQHQQELLNAQSARISELESAMKLAAIRMEILVDRMRGCHEETGKHQLLDEAQMFVDEAKAALKGQTHD